MTFVDELTQRGLISEGKLSGSLRLADEKYEGNLEDALVAEGVSSDDILDAKSAFYNIPKRTPDPKLVTTEILKYIPEDSAKHYHFIPIGLEDGALIVGVTNPENIQATDALQFIAE